MSEAMAHPHTGDSPSCRVIRRTPEGWRTGEVDLPDLLNAIVLADLLAAELGEVVSGSAPARADEGACEVEQLRMTVAQLEHALSSRVVVEQAIGVLAERHRSTAREAFHQLRCVARSRGRKVVDLARMVVSSSSNPLTSLPAELARPGSVSEAPRSP